MTKPDYSEQVYILAHFNMEKTAVWGNKCPDFYVNKYSKIFTI